MMIGMEKGRSIIELMDLTSAIVGRYTAAQHPLLLVEK